MDQHKITLEYFDQNEDFKSFMPRKAAVVRELTSTATGKRWLLLQLEHPFTYGLPNAFGNHTLENTHLLISTRHEGEQLEDPVFHAYVLLVPELPSLDHDSVEIDDSLLTAWCIAKRD